MLDLLIIIGTAVVTGIILLVIGPIAQWLRPVRAYDLDRSPTLRRTWEAVKPLMARGRSTR